MFSVAASTAASPAALVIPLGSLTVELAQEETSMVRGVKRKRYFKNDFFIVLQIDGVSDGVSGAPQIKTENYSSGKLT